MHAQHIAPSGRRYGGWLSRRHLLALGPAILGGGLGTPRPARAAAQPTPRDLRVVTKAVGFLHPPPGSTVQIALAYGDAAGPGRIAAEQLAEASEGLARVGGLSPQFRAVSLEQLRSGVMPAVVVLAEALPSDAGLLAGLVRGRGVLTITSDPALVRAGLLVMAVRSEPRVEILVSRVAEQAAGVTFAPAFRMMIQEQ